MPQVRPYPVSLLTPAREALSTLADGRADGVLALVVAARDALEDLDPDEVRLPVLDHPHAGERDKAAWRAALDVADTFEGVVAVGATIGPAPRLRGFLLTCAAVRDLGLSPDLSDFKALCRGGPLPGLGPEDAALYGLLPVLVGLGPDLAVPAPDPVPDGARPVVDLLGLSVGDVAGIDPLDGLALPADACVDGPEAWSGLLARGRPAGGLMVRPDP